MWTALIGEIQDSRSGSPEIIFECPPVAEAFGGVRLILRHVEILKRAGVPASLRIGSTSPSSLWSETEHAYSGSVPVQEVWVLPETNTEALLRPGRKVILSQSFGFISTYPPGTVWREHQVKR